MNLQDIDKPRERKEHQPIQTHTETLESFTEKAIELFESKTVPEWTLRDEELKELSRFDFSPEEASDLSTALKRLKFWCDHYTSPRLVKDHDTIKEKFDVIMRCCQHIAYTKTQVPPSPTPKLPRTRYPVPLNVQELYKSILNWHLNRISELIKNYLDNPANFENRPSLKWNLMDTLREFAKQFQGICTFIK